MFQVLCMNKTSVSSVNASLPWMWDEKCQSGFQWHCSISVHEVQKDGAGVLCQLINIWVFMIHTAAVALPHLVRLIFQRTLACFVFLILSWWESKWGSNMMGLSSQTWGKVMTSVHHRSATAVLLGWNANMQPSPAARAQPGTANSRWQAPEGFRGWARTHGSLPLLLFELLPESEELLVLAWNKINGRVLQQRSKDEEEAYGHPDVDGFHVGHLWGRGNGISQVT